MEFVGNQNKVIEYGKGTLLVEAGPGSGKTTVIVERIKHLIREGIDPDSFLVITFTNKAADNLKYKLRKELSNDIVLKMQISTIHSFCLEYLKTQKNMALTLIDDDASEKKRLFIQKFRKKLGFNGPSTVLDYQVPAVLKKFGEYTCFNVDSEELLNAISESRVVSEDYINFINSMDYFNKKRIDDHDKPIKSERDKIKHQLKKETDEDLIKEKEEKIDELNEQLFSNAWYNARFLQIIKAYPIYLDLLDEYNYVDYDTLQRKALKELEDDSNTPYKTIFVDEFQDTDPLQFRIFQILKENCDYFTAVGDVDQHIYAFRSSFNDFFDELIRMEHHKLIPLNINFRSTENIVNLTEKFIDPQRKETSEKHMESNGKEYNNPNFLIKNASSEDEASNIFNIIKTLLDNGMAKESDIGILYRKHSDKTIASLVELFKNNNINFSIKGQSDLSEQNEVKSLITLMWYIARRTDIGYVPSSDELKELNLKAFCGEYFDTSFFSLDDSTKAYLCKLQDDYYAKVIENENKMFKVNLIKEFKDDPEKCNDEKEQRKLQKKLEKDKYSIDQISNVKKREDQDTIYEIFNELQMPTVDIEEISNPKDKEFFEKLEWIREKIESQKTKDSEDEESFDEIIDSNSEESEKKEEPLTILKVFYQLIALSNIYDYELSYKEIANLAILTQTISNYESFISDTDFRGVLFFLSSAIESYDSYHNEGNGVNMMTIHGAKGLEFPVTIITSLQRDKFPMIEKDPNRELDYVFPGDTFYTPNECLEYKTILKKNENEKWEHETLSIEEENQLNKEEEDRVLYVAMTRAKDLLILSTIEDAPEQVEWIENQTVPFSFDELNNVVITSEAKDEEEFEDELEGLEEPVVLNYSRYTQYISCPYKYDLSYNLGFRRFGSAKAANRGSVFHNIMEELNLKLIEGEVVGKEELAEITEKHYKPMFDIEEDPKAYEEFKNNVEKYYKEYSVNRETLEAEFNFELFIDNYVLNGFIDLIYRDSNGELVVLDYKYAKYVEGHIDGYIKQSYIYTLALRQIPEFRDYKISKAIIHFVLGDEQSDKDYQYEVEIDEEVMQKELANLREVSSKISNGVFEKEPEKAENCKQCPYRSFCKSKEFAEELYKDLNFN